MPALMAKLKEHGIYTIARVVAFRDPYLAEQKPEWTFMWRMTKFTGIIRASHG